MTRSLPYGYKASAISRSLTSGPYESAVSIKLTPSSTARLRTRRASSGSLGSPQIPGPVRRMVPKPNRLTFRSPPRVNVPVAAALIIAVLMLVGCFHETWGSSLRLPPEAAVVFPPCCAWVRAVRVVYEGPNHTIKSWHALNVSCATLQQTYEKQSGVL